MGLLDSIVSLLFVAGAGWFTIYYLIPKIESGELSLPGVGGTTPQTPPASDDAAISTDIGDVVGDVLDTAGDAAATGEGEKPPKDEKKGMAGKDKKKGKKGEKAPYDPEKGMAGKEDKKKSKKPFRILNNYIYSYYTIGGEPHYGRF